MREDGVRRALVFVTSAFSSYSGCRQYREDLMRVCGELDITEADITFDKIRVFYNHPGFIMPMIENTRDALDKLPNERRDGAALIFTAHSIPLAMAKHTAYVAQLEEASRLIAEGVGQPDYRLVYQSRSGAPQIPWLEPDIADHLRQLQADGVREAVLVPVGFISDHMEVLFDLDTEALELADELGMTLIRAATVGTHPTFVSMIRQLVEERMIAQPTRLALGIRDPNHDICPLNCCLRS
jgi:ferrochelatase